MDTETNAVFDDVAAARQTGSGSQPSPGTQHTGTRHQALAEGEHLKA